MSKHIFIFILLVFSALHNLKANNTTTPPLERVITIHLNKSPLRDALKQISAQAAFTFSYSDKAVNGDETVSLHFNAKPVRYVLNAIFGGRVWYKTHGEYVILLPNGHYQNPGHVVEVNGYVSDSLSLQKIAGATVYDALSLHSAITDAYGHFVLKLKEQSSTASLQVRKAGYRDAAIILRKSNFQQAEIRLLKIEKDSLSPVLPGINITAPEHPFPEGSLQRVPVSSPTPFTDLLLSDRLKTNASNIKDKIFRTAQLSFLPGLGTNRFIGGNVVNKYSVNIIAGYTLGTDKGEVAGVMNIDRGNVKYLQGAGVTNIVGGKLTGVQGAGVLNLVLDTVKGVQGAGMLNINRRYTLGIQAAGIGNFAPSVKGMQAAGMLNITTGRMKGAQVSGAINIAGGAVKGMQVAGMLNVSGKLQGLQGAGLLNYAPQVKGMQAAGALNVADKITGTQVSGLLNVAGKMDKGLQIAPFNIADSCGGVPIGFFSYVRDGYHCIELNANELHVINFSFRTGVKKFYNIFSIGAQAGQADPFLNFTYGLGTNIALGRTTGIDLQAETNAMARHSFTDMFNYYTIYTGLDWKLGKWLAFAAGPDFNINIAEGNTALSLEPGNYTPVKYIINHPISGNNIMKGWIGAKVALRFL